MSGKPHAGSFLWAISLDVECPHCGHDFDANLTDDFSEQMKDVQVCQAAKNRYVACPACGKDFFFDIEGGT